MSNLANTLTLAEMNNAREIAGARYRRAVDELRSAFVELGAIDHVFGNGNTPGAAVASFHNSPEAWRALQHPDFVPTVTPPADDVAARFSRLMLEIEAR